MIFHSGKPQRGCDVLQNSAWRQSASITVVGMPNWAAFTRYPNASRCPWVLDDQRVQGPFNPSVGGKIRAPLDGYISAVTRQSCLNISIGVRLFKCKTEPSVFVEVFSLQNIPNKKVLSVLGI